MNHKKFRPYYYKSKVWKKFSLGLNQVFSLSFYRNGFVFTLCHFGTILKRVEYEFGFYPKFYFRKRQY